MGATAMEPVQSAATGQEQPGPGGFRDRREDADATTPALPPGLAISRGKSSEEILAELNKSPLFMTELEENDDTAALQALAYEGSALENAEDFRERGNECFRAGAHADAKEFYGKGIEVLAVEERRRARGEMTRAPDGTPDSEEEAGRQRRALEALYVNRAACHLALGNYRSCWTDGAAALRLNAGNVKACYRSARALLAVGRIEEADDVCARGLALDGGNAGLRAVAEEIAEAARARDQRRRAETEREARRRRRAQLLAAALRARGIATRSTERPPEMGDGARLRLVPDEDDARSRLSFPTVLLYPLDLQSDVIEAFEETQALRDHLAYVLPLPWDGTGRYTPDGVECFVETCEGGLLKMGKRVALLQVLGTGRVEVVDGVVKIFVVPRDEADAWAKEFKAKKAAELGRGG